jgi:hypothetical protein
MSRKRGASARRRSASLRHAAVSGSAPSIDRMEYPKVDHSHITPRGYLNNWAVEGMIGVHMREAAGVRRLPVSNVGVRKAFYRRTRPDGSRIDDIEWSLSQMESKALPLIASIESEWPLSDERKVGVASFAAAQLVRVPAWHNWHGEFLRREIAKWRTDGLPDDIRLHADADIDAELDKAERYLDEDTPRMIRMLSLAGKIAGIFASMQWSLVRFENPVVATSDQPINVMPLTDRRVEPGPPRTGAGVLPTMEMRVPLSPHLVLLATWRDAFDEPRALDAPNHLASTLNGFTIEQADRQWFHHPDRIAFASTGQLWPWSVELFDDYSALSAYQSDRRRRTSQLVQPKLGTDLEQDVEILSVQRQAA